MVMRFRRAFTLLEVQISSFVLVMVLAAIYTILRPGFHYFAQGNVHAGLQQEVLKGMLALKGDLGDSQRSNIHVDTTPVPHTWFLSPKPIVTETTPVEFSDTGHLVWRKWTGYFLDPDNHKLMRSELKLAAATEVTTPAPLPVPTLLLFQAELGPSRRVVCRSVESFSVRKMTANVYRIEIESQQAVASDRSTAVKLATEIWVRNE
jgi:hypothetical protein